MTRTPVARNFLCEKKQVIRSVSSGRPAGFSAHGPQEQHHGKVIVRFLLLPDGHVERIRVVSAEFEDMFEESLPAVVQTWRFVPRHGRACRLLL